MIFASRRGKDHDTALSSALMYLNYYQALIFLDSMICSDQSSGEAFLLRTMVLFRKLVNDKDLTIDQKRQAVDTAMELEEETFPFRKKNPSLCIAGMTEYAKELHIDLDPKPQSSTTPSSTTGLYVDDQIWRQKRIEALSTMKDLLLTLNGVQAGQ